MTFPPRRVVTGHDESGRAIVVSDEVVGNVTARRRGHRSFVLWASEHVPARNDGAPDPPDVTQRSLPDGVVFRIAELAPGVASAPHATDSVDFAIVLSGEADLVLDDAEPVRLRAGDTLVQRGTRHDWANPGEVPCVIAFVLVGARPLS